MRRRVITGVGWASWVLAVTMAVLTPLVHAWARSSGQPAGTFRLVELVIAVSFPTVGVLITTYRPSNTIGWLLNAIGLILALSNFALQYVSYAVASGNTALPLVPELAWMLFSLWLVGLGLIPALLLLFPDGRWPSRQLRWIGWLLVIAILLAVVPRAIFTWPLRTYALDLPEVVQMTTTGRVVNLLSVIGQFVMIAAIIVAVIALIVRLRRAVGVERQQLKWLCYAGALNAADLLVSNVFSTYIDQLLLAQVLNAIVAATIPIAIGIAVLKYRLYDIDILINRTLVYSTLTVTLALMYIGSVVVVQQLLSPFRGGSELTTIASTLTIAALFNPLRRRIQAVIDKRFYRRKYDAAKILAAFSTRLRDETDLDALTNDLLTVIDDTLQPSHMSLWLRAEHPVPRSKVEAAPVDHGLEQQSRATGQ